MWYLNRTGQTEGPYPETAILEMIRGGQLTQGQICPAGGTQWVPLQAHPPFAQALSSGGAPSYGQGAPNPAYGPPPGANPPQPSSPQYGAPAGNPQYGAPQGNPQYGAPAGNPQYAAPAAAAPGAPGQPPVGAPAKKSGKGLIIGIIAGALFLVLGGAALAVYMLFLRQPGPQLAKHYPKDTQVFIEFTGIKQSLIGLKKVKFVDDSKIDDKKTIDDAVNGIANAFDISKDDARDVAMAFNSFAVGGRSFSGGGKPEGAFVIAFGSTGPAEKLLGSKRFSTSGSIGSTGKAYTLKDRGLPYEKLKELPAVEKTLSEMQFDGTKDKMVWFEKAKLLVIGSEPMVKDVAAVIEDGKDPLEKSDVYKKAKEGFESGADAIGFVDSALLKEVKGTSERKFIDAYLKDVGPWVASISMHEAGMMMNIRGEMSGSAIPKDKDLLITKSDLTLYKKMPVETVGYMAMATKPGLKGSEARDDVLKAITEANPEKGEKMKKNLEAAEKELGVDLATFFDALGDEAIVAVVASKTYKADLKESPSWKDFAIVYVQKLNDEAAAKKLSGAIKDKIFGGPAKAAFNLTSDGDAFVAEPKLEGIAPIPRVQLKYVDKHLVLVVGSKDLSDRTFAAIDGKDTLADDAAHKLALKAMGSPQLLMWIDAGRIGNSILDAEPKIKAEATKAGIPLDAILLTGEKRMTSAMGVSWKKKDDKITYNIDGLNVSFIGPMVGGFFMFRIASAFSAPSKMPPMPSPTVVPTAPTTLDTGELPSECETLLRKQETCLLKALPAADRKKSLDQLRDSYKKTPAAYRSTMCKSAIEALEKSMPSCK